MPDVTRIYKGDWVAKDQGNKPPSAPVTDGEGTGSFVWNKIIKRFPGYAYEVLDAISPIKTRNIDFSKDLTFGVLPLQTPPLIKGVGRMASEVFIGDPVMRERASRRATLLLRIGNPRYTPAQQALAEKEYEMLVREDFPLFYQSNPRLGDFARQLGTQYPTWTAMYTQLRDSLPGAGQLEAILTLEPERIPDATERFLESWKDEPWDTLVWGLAFTRAGLMAKVDNLNAQAKKARMAENPAAANRHLIAAERYRKAAVAVSIINPEEVVFGASGSLVKGLSYILPSPYQDARIREPFARGKETDILAKDAAEKYGAGEKGTIMSVLSDSDELASRESSLAHVEKPNRFDKLLVTPDNVEGVLNRIALTRHMADQKMKAKLEDLADTAGISYDDIFDPKFQEQLFQGVIKAYEQGDAEKIAELSKQVFDLVGQASTSFESGSRVLNIVESQTKHRDKMFDDAYESDEHKQLMETEIGDLDLTGEGDVTPDSDSQQPNDAVGIGFDRNNWNRIEDSIFSHVLDGEVGRRLLETFEGSKTKGMINVEKAVRAALPALADLKVRIENGNINADYAIMEELAYAIKQVDALIKRESIQDGDYVAVENVVNRELSQELLIESPQDVNARSLYKIVLKGRANPSTLRDFIRGYVEKVKTMDAAPVPKEEMFKSILGEGFDQVPESTGIDIAPFIPNVVAKTQELIDMQGHTRTIMADPDIETGIAIVNQWLSEDVAEELGGNIAASGIGIRIGDFVRLRKPLATKLALEVENGRMTQVGAGKLQNQIYNALNLDIYHMIDEAVEAGKLTPEDAARFRKLTQDYSDQMDLQNTETSQMVRRFDRKPEDFMPWLLKANPDRLEEFKQLLSEDELTVFQKDMFAYIVHQAQDRESGVPTAKGVTDQLDKLQVPLNDLLGDNASTLLGLVDEMKRLETIPALRETKAYGFIVNNYDKSGKLYSELIKTDSLFDPDELGHLKTILGAERWEAMKVNLLGQMFERNNWTTEGNEAALKKLLGKMTDRDKNRLVDIFGEEQARELVEMGEFWNRHLRLSGWNKNSNTAFHQEARNWLQKRTAVAMMKNFVYWMQIRNASSRSLNVVDFASASIIFGVFAGPLLFKKFVSSERGRDFMMGGGIKVPGTQNMYVTRESLDRAADFMLRNRLELGITAHTIGERQTELEQAERQEKRKMPVTPPWRGGQPNFLPH